MKSWKKSCSLAIAATILCSCSFGIFGAAASQVAQKEQTPKTAAVTTVETDEEFLPVFRMAVMSDTHVAPNEDPMLDLWLEQSIQAAYNYSDAHATYKTLDVLAVTGDLANAPDYDPDCTIMYREIIFNNLRRETGYIGIRGNHDVQGDGLGQYYDHVSNQDVQHICVKGFHVMGVSNFDFNGAYTRAQRDFLKEQIELAEAEDPNKPIFTLQHNPMESTVYGSEGGSPVSNSLTEIFNAHSQVINFSGHSHAISTSERGIWQDGYTALQSGALRSLGVRKTDRFAPIDGTLYTKINDDATGYFKIVEVDAQNRVRIYSLNKLGMLAKTPSTTDDPNNLLVFKIDNLKDPSTFLYTDARRDTATAPYFNEGAAIQVTNKETNEETSQVTVHMSVPQMQDDFCPYYYKVVATAADGTERIVYHLDEFYHGDNVADENLFMDQLVSGTEYTITIYPANQWGIIGEPLTTTVTA